MSIRHSGFQDIIEADGSLVPPTAKAPQRPYEVIEALYGMIYVLANDIAQTEPISVEEIIYEASRSYEKGLALSPTKRYGTPSTT